MTFAARNPKKIKTTADEVEAEDEAAETEADEVEAVSAVTEVADEAEDEADSVTEVDEEVSVVTEVDEAEAEEHQVLLLKPTEDPSKNIKEARKHLTTLIKLIN